MRTALERAAGGIVTRGGKFLLVRVRNLEGKVVWTFPKGHLERGERWLDAALREVEEETGWRCRARGLLSRAQYRFRRKGRPVFKRVRWYRMDPVEKTGVPDADEIRATRWATPAAARAALSYPGDRRVLEKAWRGEGKSSKLRSWAPSRRPRGGS